MQTFFQVIMIILMVILLQIGSSDDEALSLINVPTNPIVLGVGKGALLIVK